MKKLNLMMLAVFAVFAFQACKNKGQGSSSATDSTNLSGDTSAMAAVNTTPLNKGDSTFAVTAANDGMTEVQLGKIAAQKATTTRIKNFANMMVTDHSRIGDELTSIAKAKNLTLPSSPDADSQKKIDELNKKSGKSFDKAYVDAMVKGHEGAVKLFTDASNNLQDSTLKAFANNTLPTLKMHLDSIKAIKADMK